MRMPPAAITVPVHGETNGPAADEQQPLFLSASEGEVSPSDDQAVSRRRQPKDKKELTAKILKLRADVSPRRGSGHGNGHLAALPETEEVVPPAPAPSIAQMEPLRSWDWGLVAASPSPRRRTAGSPPKRQKRAKTPTPAPAAEPTRPAGDPVSPSLPAAALNTAVGSSSGGDELRRRTKRRVDEYKLLVVVEEAHDLPRMEFTGADPYCTVWYQQGTPPKQPDDGDDPPGRASCCHSPTAPVPYETTAPGEEQPATANQLTALSVS